MNLSIYKTSKNVWMFIIKMCVGRCLSCTVHFMRLAGKIIGLCLIIRNSPASLSDSKGTMSLSAGDIFLVALAARELRTKALTPLWQLVQGLMRWIWSPNLTLLFHTTFLSPHFSRFFIFSYSVSLKAAFNLFWKKGAISSYFHFLTSVLNSKIIPFMTCIFQTLSLYQHIKAFKHPFNFPHTWFYAKI